MTHVVFNDAAIPAHAAIASSLLFTSPSSSSLRYHVALKLLDTRWSWLNSKYMEEAGLLWKRMSLVCFN